MDQLARHFIENEPRRAFGHALDVNLAVTRGWWLPIALTLGFGQLVARVLGKSSHPVRRGIGYSAAIGASAAVHALGHRQAACMVEAPMDTLLFTPIRPYTLYDDAGKHITRDQDIGRAMGGPTANIAAGASALLLSLVVKKRFPRVFGATSALLGLVALVPVFGNDGEVLFLHKKERRSRTAVCSLGEFGFSGFFHWSLALFATRVRLSTDRQLPPARGGPTG